MPRIVMIGATGLIGRALAPRLARDHQLTVLGRRPTGLPGVREIVAPIDEWPAAMASWRGDIAVSTLGTTWKQAGSWDAFRAVDLEAVVGFATSAKSGGASQFVTVSSVGADADSRNRYLALKGEVEQRLDKVGFDRLDVVRPGLLKGNRANDRRFGERIGILVSPAVNLFLRGSLDRFAAIEAATVAAAIAGIVGAKDGGRFVHLNRQIRAISKHR